MAGFYLSVGDASGFLALILIGVSSVFMLLRTEILRVTRNLAAVRAAHVTVSALAGVFILVHVSSLFEPPISFSVDAGYLAAGLAVGVWLTGTAFLQRLRDSLFFHGVLTSVLIGVIMVHAGTSKIDIPPLLSEAILGTTFVVMLANAVYQLVRGVRCVGAGIWGVPPS